MTICTRHDPSYCWVAGSARVLITHQRQYLPQCDRVLVLRGGRVHALGTPQELAPVKLPELQATEGDQPCPFHNSASHVRFVQHGCSHLT